MVTNQLRMRLTDKTVEEFKKQFRRYKEVNPDATENDFVKRMVDYFKYLHPKQKLIEPKRIFEIRLKPKTIEGLKEVGDLIDKEPGPFKLNSDYDAIMNGLLIYSLAFKKNERNIFGETFSIPISKDKTR